MSARNVPFAAQRADVGGEKTVERSLGKAVEFLLSAQADEGYWAGEFEGDTILASEYIILMAHLRRWNASKARKAAAYIRSKQMENGGWPVFPDGPVDASASVEAYMALKLAGDGADQPHMVRAREAIRQAGGVRACNSYTKFYLAMLGQIPWSDTPAVPPELMLLPNKFYFNIYEISSWSRTFVVPLSIIWARKSVTRVERGRGVDELFEGDERATVRLRIERPLVSWRNFFVAADALVKAAERLNIIPLRKKSIERASQWMLEHCEHSAGLGAIFPPMVYSLIALRVLKYPDDSPEVRRAWEELEKLEIEEEDTLRLQPCISPVWDTAIAVNALSEAGVDEGHPALRRAGKWLVSKEVKMRGDWQVKRPALQPGGWYFEFANEFYPDIDDTAMVMMGLERTRDVAGKEEACRRALAWLLGMQGRDGGWASFDVDNDKAILNSIPFADHNAMLDPSTSDITARILEMFSFYGIGPDQQAAQRGIEFLRREQEDDGSWYGRWGVNYIYGTWQALRGLSRMGLGPDDPAVRRGAAWLADVQNEDGGWGESCISYYEPSLKTEGEGTASQTAWALMGLMCAGMADSDEVTRGIDYLLRTQTQDGTWQEEQFTGAGFPKVFYIKYHLYRHSFPVMALGMHLRERRAES